MVHIPIKKFFATHHSIQFFNIRKFIGPDINAIIEKWMLSDMLWALGFEVINMS
jgi:hypothetical protein